MYKRQFLSLGLGIKDQSSSVPQYFLKYPNKLKGRSILKVDVTFPAPVANEYEAIYFSDLAKTLQCQTIESMFSNKLVALIERYEKNNSIAGRDIFDINSFYQKNIKYRRDIIEERRSSSLLIFFKELKIFVQDKITQQTIDEDLNPLLSSIEFKKIRKFLKQEMLFFIDEQLKELS